MKIKLVCIGGVKDANIASAIATYAKRVPFYWPFQIIEIPDVKLGKNNEPQRQKDAEGERFMAEIGSGDYVILFDERGREFTSRQFSDFIQKKSVDLPKNLIFLIGGPYGFSAKIYDRADGMLSLSKMTFPHELCRLFAVEQLYRAGTIMRGEPYHHD